MKNLLMKFAILVAVATGSGVAQAYSPFAEAVSQNMTASSKDTYEVWDFIEDIVDSTSYPIFASLDMGSGQWVFLTRDSSKSITIEYAGQKAAGLTGEWADGRLVFKAEAGNNSVVSTVYISDKKLIVVATLDELAPRLIGLSPRGIVMLAKTCGCFGVRSGDTVFRSCSDADCTNAEDCARASEGATTTYCSWREN